MKSKKRIGLVAAALTALAFVLPGTSQAAVNGDVRSINFHGNPEHELGVVENLDRPLVAGDKVRFSFRLLNRPITNEMGQATSFDNPWVLRPMPAYSSLENGASRAFMPKVGVWVSGHVDYADIVSWKPAEDALSAPDSVRHTELVCEYTVKPGDFAMPLRLVSSSRRPALDGPANAEPPEAKDYLLTNDDIWGFFPSNTVGVASDDRLRFYFGPETLPTAPAPGVIAYTGAAAYKPSERRDYDLSQLKIQVKSVDFDETMADTDARIWRTIKAGTSTALPVNPRLITLGNTLIPTNTVDGTYKFYVWSENDAIAQVDGGESKNFTHDNNTVSRKVATVEFRAGDNQQTFSIKAMGNPGDTTTIYMSDTPTNIYNHSDAVITNFVSRTISIGEPPLPSISVVLYPEDDDNRSFYATDATTGTVAVASIDVELSQAWSQDMTILITPEMVGSTTADPFKYIGMSTAQTGADAYAGTACKLVIPAGQTKASLAGGMLHVFANRADLLTEKGIRFVPSVDPTSANAADAEAFLTGEDSSATLQLNSISPVIVPALPVVPNVPANAEHEFTINVFDTRWNLHGKNEGEGKYTVVIDTDSNGNTIEIPDLLANGKGEIKFKHNYTIGGRTYRTTVYVRNQDGFESNSASYDVQVNVARKVIVTTDAPGNTYCEGTRGYLSFKFSQQFDRTSGFVFLTPLDEATSNLVECSAVDRGISISLESDTPSGTAEVFFKDGWQGARFRFGVQVRTENDPTDPSNIIKLWGSDEVTLFATNAAPSVYSVVMNDEDMNVSGGTFNGKAAKGVQNQFVVNVVDKSTEVDLHSNLITVVKFCDKNSAVLKTVTLTNDTANQVIPFTFPNVGNNKVTVQTFDKDMSSIDRLTAPTFTAFVDTTEAPAISLSPYNSKYDFEEDPNFGADDGRINVDLTVAPTRLDASGFITVRIEVECDPPSGTYPIPTLNTYDIKFGNGDTHGEFYLENIDGTILGKSKGYKITAKVIDETTSPDVTKTWAQYYAPAEAKIKIINKNPKIIIPGVDESSTNATTAAINVPVTISWYVEDIDADLANLTVTWSGDGELPPTHTTNLVGVAMVKQDVSFRSSGRKAVTLLVEDKDGGRHSRTLYYYVAPSKVVKIHPRRGNAAGISKFSNKFVSAAGIGDGRVWASDVNAPSEIENFVHQWSYSPETLSATVYARGYKFRDGVGDIDNGSLGMFDGGKDFAITPAGGVATAEPYYQYYNRYGKDSFFYSWILNTSGGEAGYEGAPLVTSPEVGNQIGTQVVRLPDYDEAAVTYEPLMIEAIFSLEYLTSDNLGDINQDGIPDRLAVTKLWKDGANLVESAGFTMEDENPGDLKNISGWNDDAVSTIAGGGAGDFLPSAVSAGSAIIPNISSWSTLGQKFTARTEMRGFHEGLNYREESEGLNYNVTGAWVSAPYFSKAEWMSIAAHNPDCGVDLAASEDWDTDVMTVSNWLVTASNAWIPENRTDPTVDDTDEDGFPDGYEYYYWYKAAVGEITADGKWVRLTGSRFTLNDIATGEVLSSDDIAKAFNPTVASAAGYETRDTDNDGLTDLEELAMGTNPINWDSDGDGMSDFWEVMNGLSPLSAKDADGASMNLDGDFMARWDSEASYTLATFKLADGTVREYAIAGNPARYFDIADGGAVALSEDAKTNQFVAISVFRYGTADKGALVPRFRGGLTKNTVDYFGEAVEAKPLDALVIDLGDATDDTTTVTLKEKQKITLIHDQVRAQFGFDPRTAWYSNKEGYVADRWNPTSAGKVVAVGEVGTAITIGDAGKAINTVPYTALDEYYLLKYRYETNKESSAKFTNADGEVYEVKNDEARWVLTLGNRKCGEVFINGTTAPNAPFESADWVTEQPTMGTVNFASTLHGADTDTDGVPDGWELYTGRTPNVSDKDADEDGDDLKFPAEYAGTDSCNAYTNCPSIFANHPGFKSGWFNKFFPTNPDDYDTDGDTISDSEEGATWVDQFAFGNSAVTEGVFIHTYTFIYGTKDFSERDDGNICIRGGGLNPCTVDTDGDCLPDPWERQFAGIVFNTSAQPANGPYLNPGELEIARRSDGNSSATDQYITLGMDGTDGNDAWSNPRYVDEITGTIRDYDFDHDGLQNYQEYYVQSLRHLRYDDSSTPLMGQWMPSGSPDSLRYFGFIPMNIMDGETFYAAVKEAGYPATAAWDFRELGYFARPPHEWDKMALAVTGGSNYDETGFRLMLPPNAIEMIEGGASGYCSTDPRNWDSDFDGMDDYYELFHGLNPLLGDVTGGMVDYDLVSKAYGYQIANWCNAWTGWPMTPPADPVYDVMRFPWMMGTPGCDADGDGLNNYEEAIFANMTSPQPTHTDPTPLWMTDSTSLKNASFVSQYYSMDCDSLEPDFAIYPWPYSKEGYLFAFEENEGYDTDHDGINDSEEKKMTVTALSDPLNFADPDRRQAIWFSGENSAAVSYTTAPNGVTSVDFDTFRQFTVEAWINPEDVSRNQVILERAVCYSANTLSNNVTKLRANFRLGIMADGRLYGLFDTANAVTSDTPGSTAKVMGPVLAVNTWAHIALTYNGRNLRLFMNGNNVGETQTTLIPANGITGAIQQPIPGVTGPLVNGYVATEKSAMVLGATAIDPNAVSLSADTTWDAFDSFYAGFIDEVRVWDGVKTETEIAEGCKKRMSVADVAAQRKAVIEAMVNGATRNDNDSNVMLPAELVFHYNFSTLPAALDPIDTMWEPVGFTENVMDNVRIAGKRISGELYCGWWKNLPIHSDVYANYRLVPWIPNTVSHLPAIDGTVADSMYWSQNLAGMAGEWEASNTDGFIFPNSMNPYSLFHTMSGNDLVFYHNRLVQLNDYALNVLNEYKARNYSLGVTDLLPLGGAFAKSVNEMWDGQGPSDAWAYTVDDLDANGLSDWWEDKYLKEGKFLFPDEPITLESLVSYNGDEITAREAYLRDLAAGMQPFGEMNADFKAKSDRDHDGMPDWWENLYGIADENGEDDFDGDGLSNFAEYLISECFSSYDFPKVKPDQARTFVADGQLVNDYFLTKGQLYLGEMFTDHDFCEDTWEDNYNEPISNESQTLFASRYVSDMWADNDGDGWSNFAECRVGTDPRRTRSTNYVEPNIPEYPIPVMRLNATYSGSKSVENAPLVVRTYSAASVMGKPDAVWKLAGMTTTPQTGANAGEGDAVIGTPYSMFIGPNPGEKMTINLGGGMIVPGSLSVDFRDLNSVSRNENGAYLNNHPGGTTWCLGLREYIDVHNKVYADIHMGGSEGYVVGRLNYETGDLTIDFSKLEKYHYNHTNKGTWSWVEPTGEWEGEGESRKFKYYPYERRLAANCYIRVSWNAQTAASENTWNATLAKTEIGHVREGMNTFEVFADLNGDGLWTPGEPYGVVADVDVGWSTAMLNVQLTDIAPQMFRIDLAAAILANDFDSQNLLNDRGVYNSLGFGYNFRLLDAAVGKKMPAAAETETRVRVVRAAVNGYSGIFTKTGGDARYIDGVVLDVKRNLSENGLLTERDLVDSGYVDLDWEGLAEAASAVGESFASVTSVAYRVVIGDGTVSADDVTNNNALATAFVNIYERGVRGTQTPCAPVSPKGTIYSAQPTFKWTHKAANGKEYPAFQLRVWKGATLVYDSGVRNAPMRNSSGEYVWTAPIYADMITPQGEMFSNTNNYTWAVSMLDSKFTTPNTNEVKSEFRVEATGLLGSIADYGILKAKVHYFGPVPTGDSVGMVRVQAFKSADFAGVPAGEARVTDLAALSSGEGATVTMRGLPVGTYYVRAFIDTKADCEFSNWESWGYACFVGDGAAKTYRFTPKPFMIVKNVEAPEAEVFIEDMDTDNDGIPDAWEWDSTNDSLSARNSPTGNTFFTKVNPTLAATVAGYVNIGNSGMRLMSAAASVNVYASMTLMNALISEDATTVMAMGKLLSAPMLPPVSEKYAVKIDRFSLNDGIDVSVATEVTGVGNELVIVGNEATVGVVLVASDKVDFSNATEIRVKEIVIKANDTTPTTISAEEVKRAIESAGVDKAAFFKVKLVQ